MKYVIALLFSILSINAYALDPCFTGSWYDQKRSGEGINIEVSDDGKLTVAYFYTFDKNRQQVWYTFVGQEALTMYQTVLLDYDKFITDEEEVGVGLIEPVTDDVLIFAYDQLVKWLPQEEEFVLCNAKYDDTCKGAFVYRRITQPIACDAQPK